MVRSSWLEHPTTWRGDNRVVVDPSVERSDDFLISFGSVCSACRGNNRGVIPSLAFSQINDEFLQILFFKVSLLVTTIFFSLSCIRSLSLSSTVFPKIPVFPGKSPQITVHFAVLPLSFSKSLVVWSWRWPLSEFGVLLLIPCPPPWKQNTNAKIYTS